MTHQRTAVTGFTWHVHHGYARSRCKHRTNQAMQKCAAKVVKMRERDARREATR